LALKQKTPWLLIALGVLGAIKLFKLDHDMVHLRSFMYGMAAAAICDKPSLIKAAKSPWASLLVLSLPTIAVQRYDTAYTLMPSLLLAITFCLIACGNTLFGAFTHAVSRTLGEMAYGIYLLHGLLLYTLFTYVLGIGEVTAFTPEKYWLTVAAIVPLLICICYAAHRLIEQPAMRNATKATECVRRVAQQIKGRIAT